jgi:hypothetical protein
MDQIPNYKHKIDFLLSNDTFQAQTAVKQKPNVCNECNRKRKFFDESHQVCLNCYKAKLLFKSSGNKVIDDFIKHTLIIGNRIAGKMVFVPFEQFKNVEYIAEGGFSKIYKATWIDGPAITRWSHIKQIFSKSTRNKNYLVVLKKLNNSKSITSKELNEVIIIIN